ncbi:MAG: hypothetical protein HY040_19840 [Planctomycetes bacterium]|nr:hypothetical protein [Planctomycetota bacterium]
MRRSFLVLAWAFIFAAAAYDAYFAWLHRELMHLWEQNPFAARMVGNFGLVAFFLFKFAGLFFAAALAVYVAHGGVSNSSGLRLWPLVVFTVFYPCTTPFITKSFPSVPRLYCFPCSML